MSLGITIQYYVFLVCGRYLIYNSTEISLDGCIFRLEPSTLSLIFSMGKIFYCCCSCVCVYFCVEMCCRMSKSLCPHSSSSSHRSSHITLNCLLILLYSIFRITTSILRQKTICSIFVFMQTKYKYFHPKLLLWHTPTSANDSSTHPIESNVP